MNARLRIAIVAVLLVFAWRGKIDSLKWLTPSQDGVAIGRPDDEAMKWTVDLPVNDIAPADRQYYSAFYDALGSIIGNDGTRPHRLIDTSEKFAKFHAGSLDLAIDMKHVGKVPGLGDKIDAAFIAAAGDADVKQVDSALADRYVRCCKALAWRLAIHGE